MKKLTKIKNVEVRKDQLLSEGNFIYYCNNSNNRVVTMTGKFHRWVDENFLRAIEKDGFLKPLLIIDQLTMQADGSQKNKSVHYYSPFQIYIVSQLSHNNINEEGYLQSPESIKWQNEQKTRFISWGFGGGMSFNINNNKTKKNASGGPNELMICNYLHDFLCMLHSLDLVARYSKEWKEERRRYYTESPNLQFDFSNIKTDGLKFLKQFGLTIKILETLRVTIGQTALIIDPLEKWYSFLQRLPQWRKDELKGEALLAQDLYGLCEIVADIIENVSSTRPQGLLETLRSDLPFPDNKRIEYASGTDIEAIKFASLQLETWLANKKNLNVLIGISGNDVKDNYFKQLEEIDHQLTDYENRYKKYGEGRYVTNRGFLYVGTQNYKDIDMSELDSQTKHTVEQMMSQLKAQGGIENEPVELQGEIRHAIRWRLDDIQRNLFQLIHVIIQPLDSRRWQLDSEKQVGQQHMWWGEYARSGEAPTDPIKARIYYMEKFRIKKEAEFDKKIKPILDATHSLGSFLSLTRLVLCANCRKNQVILHQTHNDQRVSSEAICDDCIKKGELQKIKGAEWSCRWCGRKIYTFAHGNILSDVLLNTSNATIELDYGRITIRARCPNKDCKEWNEDSIDWGWLQ